jgi:hypothetical protein
VKTGEGMILSPTGLCLRANARDMFWRIMRQRIACNH